MTPSRLPSRVLPLLLCLLAACGGTDTNDRPAVTQAAACAEVDCGPGRCVLDGEQAACLCDEGYRAEALRCVQATVANPCEPNPCADLARSACSVVDAKAVCSCPAGHAPVGDSCSAQAAFDCSERAPAGTGDAAEPDACPTLARGLVMDAALEARTLAPAGDTDWLALSTQVGHIYEVRAESGTLGLSLDVMSADGFTPIAFDHLGAAGSSVRFRAEATGYRVRVSALDASRTGAYRIQVRHEGMDDFGDTVDAASQPLPMNTTVLGSLQFSGDQDVMRVTLKGGFSYELLATAGSSAAASLVLELLSTDGTLVLRRSSGSPARLAPLLSTTGAYAVRVRSSTGQALGSYSLAVRELGMDDHGNAPSDATSMALGSGVVSGTLDYTNDVDVFAVQVQEGYAYRFGCQLASYNCRTRALDADGNTLMQRNDGWSSELVVKAPRSGLLYFEVAAPSLGNYQVSASIAGRDEYGDTLATATPLSFSASLTAAGLQAFGDVDTFSFPVVAGRIYRFTCTGQSFDLACVVQLKSASGAVLVTAYASWYGSAVAGYEAKESGTLYAEVSNGTLYATGLYAYRVEDVGVDDHGDAPASATPVVAGSAPAEGAFELAGDVDAFSFDATAGHVYQFSCTAPVTGCLLRLRDAAGTLLFSSESTGLPLAHEVTVSGRYTVEASGSPSTSATFGTYAYQLTDLGADDTGDVAAEATELPADATGQGRLESYVDVDVFRFSAPAGHVVRFNCKRSGTQPSGGCNLRLKSAAGVVLETGYGSVAHEAGGAPATLYVEVYRESYGALYAYSYSLEDLGQDDHGDSVLTASELTPGAPALAGELETLGDLDVFRFEATALHLYRVECIIPSTSCLVRLRTASGALLRESYTSLELEVAAAEAVYVEVAAGYSGTRGSYSLRVVDLGVDDHGDDSPSASPMTLGTPVSGRLEISADVDVFEVNLSAGVTYQLLAALDPLNVAVRDPDMAQVLAEQYTPSSGRSFTTGAAGRYTVWVRRYYSSTDTYQLTVR